MADLTKRMRTNPFYAEAVKMLGKRNFHMVRPEYAEAGGIKIIVSVQDRQRRETTKEFTFPARMEGLAMMQWKAGFSNDLNEMEKAGYLPSAAQFERLREIVRSPPPPVKKPEPAPEPEVVRLRELEAERVLDEATRIEKARVLEEEPTTEPKMVVVLDSPVSSLITILMLNDLGEFVNDPEVRVSLAVPRSKLSDFLEGVDQSDARVVVINPEGSKSGVTPELVQKPEHVPSTQPLPKKKSKRAGIRAERGTVIPESLTDSILRAFPSDARRVVDVRAVAERLHKLDPKKFPDEERTKLRVGTQLPAMQKSGLLVRVSPGRYRRHK